MTTVSRFGYVLPLAPRIQSSQRRCWLLRPRVTSCRPKPVVDCIYAKKKSHSTMASIHTFIPRLRFWVLNTRFRLSFVLRSRCCTLRLAKYLWPQRSWSPPPAEPHRNRVIQRRNQEHEISRDFNGSAKLENLKQANCSCSLASWGHHHAIQESFSHLDRATPFVTHTR